MLEQGDVLIRKVAGGLVVADALSQQTLDVATFNQALTFAAQAGGAGWQ